MGEISEAVPSFLSALRSLPHWVLVGLALAGYAILFVPSFGGIDIEPFRRQWGSWLWVESITFTILAGARIVETAIEFYRKDRAEKLGRRALRFVPLQRQNWWHLAKQQDDSFISQIHVDIQASNLSDHPVQIVKVRLIRPSAQLVHAEAMLPATGSPYHSHRHPIPPRGTVQASLHIMARGRLARQGKSIRISIGVTDQYGEEYKLKNLTIATHDKVPEGRTLLQRWRHWRSWVMQLFRLKPMAVASAATPMPWTFEPGHDYLNLSQSILDEERRNYAARGRRTGQLGSLNVGLQSEPNNGWTQEGKVPELLWPKGKATSISSQNLDRLVTIHAGLNRNGKKNLERYLLTQLSKESPYADVGYFIFIALHRMGRSVDALKTACNHLAGDKVFGYSNILGVLSTLLSHEHADLSDKLLLAFPNILDGDPEPDFRVRQKLNLARLERLGESSSSAIRGSRATPAARA